MMYVKPSVK
ncbi:UNVERIFIED_CONTAM: hypothetical protein GTU68_067318 [Idotea baltica]|nr:hypothetical protein [Idotea baltica]